MLDLDQLAVILAEMRRNRQQIEGMLDRTCLMAGIAERQLNQVLLHLGRATLDLRLVLELADPGATLGPDVVIDIQATRR